MPRKKKTEAVETVAATGEEAKTSKVKRAPKKAAKSKAPAKRPGRKPMTAAQKAEAAKKRAEDLKKAANLKPSIILQYQGNDAILTGLVDAVKEDFKSQKKRTLITDMQLYIKPEENTVYYVINGNFQGKLSL